ncbi:MAG: type IV-A pilus assembly ATPase PilB [Patescibacteria group bacterium]|nr:MAG: type IV-A pilus assembly ATPase PilB [Patescibacteria group bacterium]
MVSNEEFTRILLERELITDSQAEELKVEAESKKVPVYYLVLEKQFVTDGQIAGTMAQVYNVPLAPLGKMAVKKEVLKTIPEIVARSKLVVPFALDNQGLKIAVSDPKDLELIEFIHKKTGENVIVHYATPKQIDEALRLYRKDIKVALKKLLGEVGREAKKLGRPAEVPIIKIVDMLLSYGDQNRASDVHIEPREDGSLVRYRIDGLLHDVAVLPRDVHEEIVTRIKVLAGLRTDEHQAAQDGKLTFRMGTDLPKERQEKMDVRVSIVPTTHGEKVVLRLLSARVRQFSLEDMGFSQRDLKKIKAAYEKPYGMIVASGPTGSGKTTTMYAILKLLNERDVNITTIEDPVEYDMGGVNQIQINPKTGLTFATGLRSIVRQDPDIILVGEIRDSETASIAVNAAMTGHLVLSTMHANDASTTLIRFLDMGVEPFLVSSSVNVVIAQRLLRVLCSKCKKEKRVSAAELRKHFPAEYVREYLGKGAQVKVWIAQGCPVCQYTGYVDRIGIHEVLLVDDDIRRAIIDRRDAEAIQKMSVGKGMTTMLEDGFLKVSKGVTTIEEILRVVKD